MPENAKVHIPMQACTLTESCVRSIMVFLRLEKIDDISENIPVLKQWQLNNLLQMNFKIYFIVYESVFVKGYVNQVIQKYTMHYASLCFKHK